MGDPGDVDPRDFAFYERVAGKVASEQVVNTYLDLTAMAFDACVSSFTGGKLTGSESKCISNVTKKYLAHHNRVTMRFTEAQALHTKEQLEQAEKARREVDDKIAELAAQVKAKEEAPAAGSSR